MSQTEWIIAELKHRPLTPMDALNGCGCFRLAARIDELRASGHNIETIRRTLPSGKVVAEYHLKERA